MEIGHLMCDEMKLNEGLFFNASNNNVVGLANTIGDLQSELKKVLSKEDGEAPIACSVNQWRYRSATGKVFNCEFFLNNGELNGAELVQQFHHVVMACEAISCQVHGFQCDAGGNNARMVKFLRNGSTADEAWLPEQMVCVTNPVFADRKIYIWHCIVHIFKALRNALYASRDSGARSFHDKDNNPFGWMFVVASFQRDTRRASPITNLTKKSVIIDGWSAMNVSAAKSVSAEKTVAEGVTYICHGIWFEAVQHLKRQSCTDSAVKSEIAAIEFLSVLSSMFNEFLLNKTEKLNKDNIDDRESYLRFYLDYFHKWKESTITRKVVGDKGR